MSYQMISMRFTIDLYSVIIITLPSDGIASVDNGTIAYTITTGNGFDLWQYGVSDIEDNKSCFDDLEISRPQLIPCG